MAQEFLVLRPFCLDEEVFVVTSVATSVGSNCVIVGSGIRFHNLGKVGQRLVGCLMVVKISHGYGNQGGEGRVGYFLFLFTCLGVEFPPL